MVVVAKRFCGLCLEGRANPVPGANAKTPSNGKRRRRVGFSAQHPTKNDGLSKKDGWYVGLFMDSTWRYVPRYPNTYLLFRPWFCPTVLQYWFVSIDVCFSLMRYLRIHTFTHNLTVPFFGHTVCHKRVIESLITEIGTFMPLFVVRWERLKARNVAKMSLRSTAGYCIANAGLARQKMGIFSRRVKSQESSNQELCTTRLDPFHNFRTLFVVQHR